MKIIFFGSDDFALKSLEALSASEHEVVCCVTQPDKPQGRGLKTKSSVIKEYSVGKKISVLQPLDLLDKEFLKKVRGYNCDLFVVIAYGKILPAEVLQIPYVCAMNVHGSLLPKYRGAAPVNWAIINGEEETGVSLIKMNAQMDAGDIFAQAKIKIEDSDTAVTLRVKMAELSAKVLVKTINTLEKNEYTLTEQNSREATFAPKLTKELGRIDWSKKASDIHNLVRGLLPWPAAYTVIQGKQVKVLETEIDDEQQSASSASPGQIIKTAKDGIIIATGTRPIKVKSVHPESSKPMDANSFVSGYKIEAGQKWGD